MSNGYLLGELLYRTNQIQNFSKFQRDLTSNAKINNFCMLEPALRGLNIKFDAQVAHAIMQGKPGAVATVLYKVRLRDICYWAPP